MTAAESPDQTPDQTQPDPLDEEAAEIDPRSPEAAEQIEELVEHSAELGRHPDQPVDANPE